MFIYVRELQDMLNKNEIVSCESTLWFYLMFLFILFDSGFT